MTVMVARLWLRCNCRTLKTLVGGNEDGDHLIIKYDWYDRNVFNLLADEYSSSYVDL
jgi:hypothetical protein